MKKKWLLLWGLSTAALMWRLSQTDHFQKSDRHPVRKVANLLGTSLSFQEVQQNWSPLIREKNFPELIELDNPATRYRVQYTFDLSLQSSAQKLFQSYNPDYGAFVAIDARSGKVLALVSHIARGRPDHGISHFALYQDIPVASIFKMVTAAAAVEHSDYTAYTPIAYQGAAHTLYKRNVFEVREDSRWTQKMSLKTAFGKSMNSIFARLGIESSAPTLRSFAERFYFNRDLETDFGTLRARVLIPEDNAWKLASVASGYDRDTFMSPVHGALMAAIIANEGQLMRPYIIERIESAESQRKIYEGRPETLGKAFEDRTIAEMKKMMRATVEEGTSRKSFRSLKGLHRLQSLEIGGKTGSLNSPLPAGRIDWFVGYGIGPEGRIALSTVMINVDKWKLRSSLFAGKMIENYFRDQMLAAREKTKSSAEELHSTNVH